MNILVVDDDMIIRMVLSKYFKGKNFDVTISENGEDAYNQFLDSQDTFDIIITDIMMPIMNGIELAKKIKEKQPNLPIIAITAGDLDQIKGFEQFFEEIFNKPIELAKLHQVVIQLNPNGTIQYPSDKPHIF
ncbi:Response regulator receiver domain-containing protein [Belliella buryatensis]|uniref:Response regulator receiver domain-containing protein n=1 Tax=Belliella buryatensis TaxID=1500549 RepID=A0A239H8A9_9BACT|nr:response regulator [Belliella buryatensis]SNS77492.1 Response regulator receiver domain-containing protein [Belliella buryatensis]